MAKVVHVPLREVGNKVSIRDLKEELGADSTLTVRSAKAGLGRNKELVANAMGTEPFIALIVDGDHKTIIGSKENATVFNATKDSKINKIVRTAHGNYGLAIRKGESITL